MVNKVPTRGFLHSPITAFYEVSRAREVQGALEELVVLGAKGLMVGSPHKSSVLNREVAEVMVVMVVMEEVEAEAVEVSRRVSILLEQVHRSTLMITQILMNSLIRVVLGLEGLEEVPQVTRGQEV